LAGNRNSIRTREALMTNSKAFGDAPLEVRQTPTTNNETKKVTGRSNSWLMYF